LQFAGFMGYNAHLMGLPILEDFEASAFIASSGLTPSSIYISSNQQGYHGPDSVDLKVDDFIFLRPSHSEAVLCSLVTWC